MSNLSLAALTASCGNGNGNCNWCNDGNWNGHGGGSLKTTKRLGFLGRDSGRYNRKEGDEGELVHLGFVLYCFVDRKKIEKGSACCFCEETVFFGQQKTLHLVKVFLVLLMLDLVGRTIFSVSANVAMCSSTGKTAGWANTQESCVITKFRLCEAA